jgi:hypothetical protein
MSKGLVWVACCVAVSGTFASAQVLEVEERYWPATLTATVRVTGDGQLSSDLTTIDLKDDLGLQDKNLNELRLVLFTGPRSKLRIANMKMDYSADQDIQRTILFDGQFYTVGTRVLTKLNLEYWRYGWIWEFVGGPYSKVKIGTLVEAKRISVDAQLSAPELTPPATERKSFSQTVPTIGLVLDANPSPAVNIYAEVSGISAGSRGHALDGEAGVKLIVGRHLTLGGGYRYFDLEVKDDPDFAKLQNAGPFASASLRF